MTWQNSLVFAWYNNKIYRSNYYLLDTLVVNYKRHLVGTLFTIYKHFGDFVKCILRFCCKFSMKIIFYLISEHREAKVRRFRSICLYDCFIYRTNFVLRKCLETRRAILNSQGYSELREPVKTRDIRRLSSQSERAKNTYHCLVRMIQSIRYPPRAR